MKEELTRAPSARKKEDGRSRMSDVRDQLSVIGEPRATAFAKVAAAMVRRKLNGSNLYKRGPAAADSPGDE